MSYEYFLQAHLHQDSQEISTESILAIFSKYIIAKDETYIDLQFDEENRCTIYIDTIDSTVSGFMVSRPCGSKQLGECLYNVMLLGNFVFFEPDGKQPILVNTAAESHLPEDMIEALGRPAVAKSMDEFLELYFNNR
ncbi:hypothetical protein [Niastella sp. OAS944]|uniref:hypothetical protein n=1 Tax=Niastella sp. OAS944 TaxID=2664089 RepID=UPI003497D6D4|nr:hypothetical protein [Chitinophagaceae bacterium OAS944]